MRIEASECWRILLTQSVIYSLPPSAAGSNSKCLDHLQATSAAEPRWRRLPEERPEQILDAALAEFGERGLAGARLEDIAKRAGLSKGTIYLYFPNKEALFREMVRDIVVSQLEESERMFETMTRHRSPKR